MEYPYGLPLVAGKLENWAESFSFFLFFHPSLPRRQRQAFFQNKKQNIIHWLSG